MKIPLLRFTMLSGAVCLLSAATALADVRLPALFSDNMVLQQGTRVPVWGWADDGEKVTVAFRGQTARATAREGKWRVQLKDLKPGGPDALTVAGNNRITLHNVLVGEVWVCSGQSNMEWPMTRSFQPETDIQSASFPQIRLFQVPNVKSDVPLQDVSASWKICSPETVPGFSAVGFYFGRALHHARNVPVGLIQSDWGGSPAEVWMSREALESNPRYRLEIVEGYKEAEKNYRQALAAYEKAKDQAGAGGKKPTPPRAPWKPTELYNGMIAPLIPYAIKGAIWYQGESNAGRAHQYRSLFADMIRNWRRDWGRGNFPFLAVQLAPYDKRQNRPLEVITAKPVESDWAELREAQSLAAETLPNVGVAVITDVGDKDDIHPAKKLAVGERLALAARGIAYGEDFVYSGPIYRGMKIKGNEAIISFDHVGEGLEARGGELKGFAICGPDQNFVWANAKIAGDKVVVSSPEVEKPVAVRYGWADFPVVNLWNKDGLPASPFRTDDFPMVTAPKK